MSTASKRVGKATGQASSTHGHEPGTASGLAASKGMDGKSAILHAAVEIFARDGFDGASLPKIAETAQVKHPLIHYHFGSKEKLWKCAVAHSIGDLVDDILAINSTFRDLPPLDRLKALIRAFSLFAARNPNHLAIIMFEMRAQTSRLAWLRETYLEPFLACWESVILEGQQAGQIKNMPVLNITRIIIGGITNYFNLSAHAIAGLPDEDAIIHSDILIDILVNGLTCKDKIKAD